MITKCPVCNGEDPTCKATKMLEQFEEMIKRKEANDHTKQRRFVILTSIEERERLIKIFGDVFN